jgi:glycine cleavage system H protein
MTKGARETIHYKRSRFAVRLPVGLRYTQAHYWLEDGGDGTWRVGLTKFASRMLGDIVEYGFNVKAGDRADIGDAIGWVEGFKAVSDIYCVASGEFTGANPELDHDITLLESDPHGKGWLYTVRGEPDPGNLDVQGYIAVLDATIDKLLQSRHDENVDED